MKEQDMAIKKRDKRVVLKNNKQTSRLPVCYKYVIRPGNNSRLLLAAFRCRPWWGSTKFEEAGFNLMWERYYKKSSFDLLLNDPSLRQCINHFPAIRELTSKQGLFLSLRRYCLQSGVDLNSILPATFLLNTMRKDEEWDSFVDTFSVIASQKSVFEQEPHNSLLKGRETPALPSTGGPNSERSETTVNENGHTIPLEGIKMEGLFPDIRKRPMDFDCERELVVDGCEELQRQRLDSNDSSKVGGGVTKARRRRHSATSLKDSASNVWILKPANFTNRGVGIRIACSKEEVEDIVWGSEVQGGAVDGEKNKKKIGSKFGKKWIVQKYLEDPLLINGRKFDIRCFVLLVDDPTSQSVLTYFYREFYVRTSGEAFSLRRSSLANRVMHLTNDAVQKKAGSYGRHEAGNKMTVNQFQAYLRETYPGRPEDTDVLATILPKLHKAVVKCVQAAMPSLLGGISSTNGGRESNGAATVVKEERGVAGSATCGSGGCPVGDESTGASGGVEGFEGGARGFGSEQGLAGAELQQSPRDHRQEVDADSGVAPSGGGGGMGVASAAAPPPAQEKRKRRARRPSASGPGVPSRRRKGGRSKRSFELLGFDFMMDAQMNVWLLEANSNPCLEFSCAFLEELLPRMVESMMQVAVDKIFPPPAGASGRLPVLDENLFDLILQPN